MRKHIREREECPTCKQCTVALIEEIYCDVCGEKMDVCDNVIDCVGIVSLTTLGNKYDELDEPDICSLKCLGAFMSKVTQLEYISISIDKYEIITENTVNNKHNIIK